LFSNKGEEGKGIKLVIQLMRYFYALGTAQIMASGFFAILDDVGALMDDVAAASKIAAGKTAGILGDDLAVNAEKATGFLSSRELPVLWAITEGSLLNKAIIIPIVMLLNFFFPVAIKVILVAGGFYLAYEGVEKVIEFFFHRSKKGREVVDEKEENNHDREKSKIKAAISTDFILSIEIIIIALGSVLGKSIAVQSLTVVIVSLVATVGVYGIVALIVRMDDAGYALINRSHNKGFFSKLGKLLVNALPVIVKALSVAGTIALILVAGGIFNHYIDYLHHLFPNIPSIIKDACFGLFAGLIAVAVVTGGKKLTPLFRKR
jgi:predicted DNA repair protein MutK